MARTRYIRPDIMTNEDLCELGPYAYILFTGLWMLADREGRLEDRPKRIKAQAMPLWEITWKTCEDLLEKLCKSGFIFRYQIDGKGIIQIASWKKHQRPHGHEVPSRLPAPPKNVAVSAAVSPVTQKPDNGDQCPGTAGANFPLTLTLTSNSNVPILSGVHGKGESERKTPPPLKTKIKAKPNPKKTPGRERTSSRGSHERPQPPPPVNWWPYQEADVVHLKASLAKLAELVHMPPPDDQIVRRILDACRGAPVTEIHNVLKAAYQAHRLTAMRSWGLLPVMLADKFQAVAS